MSRTQRANVTRGFSCRCTPGWHRPKGLGTLKELYGGKGCAAMTLVSKTSRGTKDRVLGRIARARSKERSRQEVQRELAELEADQELYARNRRHLVGLIADQEAWLFSVKDDLRRAKEELVDLDYRWGSGSDTMRVL